MRRLAQILNSRWANRLIVVAGLAVVVAGIVFYGNAPAPSRHYHDDPTAGDLDGFSRLLLCGVGAMVALWGYTRNDPLRRKWREERLTRSDDSSS